MATNPLDTLRSMMAGIPTPESQALSIKTTLYADASNIGKFDEQTINEMASSLPIPDMEGTVISGQLPELIAEDAIIALMQGKKPAKQQQSPQRQQEVIKSLIAEQVQEENPAYDPTMDRDVERPFNIHEELKRKLAAKTPTQKVIQEAVKPKASPVKQISNSDNEELTDMIEDIVYKVLAQIINEAVRKKMGI
jgi:hypothetical protein